MPNRLNPRIATMTTPYDLSPYTGEQLLAEFHRDGSISKHLLTIYAICIGMNAQRIIEIGMGSTTKALRAAVNVTGGHLYSCDKDVERFGYYRVLYPDRRWTFRLCPSETFLEEIKWPIDLAVHDGDHGFYQLRQDLALLATKMRDEGIILVHDSTNVDLGATVQAAVQTVFPVGSCVTLPYCNGLTIIRVGPDRSDASPQVGFYRWLRWKLRKWIRRY